MIKKYYEIEITETLQKIVKVESTKALNAEEAEKLVRGKYNSGEIVLDSEDFVEVLIKKFD